MGGGPDDHRSRGVRQRRVRLRRIRRPARLFGRRRRRAAVARAGARSRRDRGAAAVGRSGTDRPGPRRRRRCGHHRDGRVGRTGCRRRRGHPLCARRATQLRAAAGEPRARPRRARGEGDRVRDDRNGARTLGRRRNVCGAWADGCVRRPGGPGDLAGVRPGRRVDESDGPRCDVARAIHRLGRGSGHRHPRGHGQARKGHGRTGLPDDHAGVGITVVAARGGRTPRRGDHAAGATSSHYDRRGYQ